MRNFRVNFNFITLTFFFEITNPTSAKDLKKLSFFLPNHITLTIYMHITIDDSRIGKSSSVSAKSFQDLIFGTFLNGGLSVSKLKMYSGSIIIAEVVTWTRCKNGIWLP